MNFELKKKGDGLISFGDFFKVRKRFIFSVMLLILEFNLIFKAIGAEFSKDAKNVSEDDIIATFRLLICFHILNKVEDN
jgi:hypothetical protein